MKPFTVHMPCVCLFAIFGGVSCEICVSLCVVVHVLMFMTECVYACMSKFSNLSLCSDNSQAVCVCLNVCV